MTPEGSPREHDFVIEALSTPSLGITCTREEIGSGERAFNSLSRDHKNPDFSAEGLETWKSFNSLSRDHKATRLMTSLKVSFAFQLPLSGSLKVTEMMFRLIGLDFTFNSLSRDHSPRASASTTMASGRLSTPSLGITLLFLGAQIFSYPFAFNSLSRDHPLGNRFQLGPVRDILPLSTPSLGITRRGHEKVPLLFTRTFNSLSRDHRARFRDFSALRGVLPRRPFAQMISKTTIWIYRLAPL
jgi:hypothetical protein